jgi:putative PIN family toxin of toxin-antitoxin system
MKSRPRFVFDTNVLISAALIGDSKPAEAFRKGRATGEILMSVPSAAELNEVLGREKFERYITRDDRERFLAAIVRTAVLADVTEQIAVCRDPRDDKFLELAVSGQATCIVSSDDDLLALDPFRGIRILSVEQFLESF